MTGVQTCALPISLKLVYEIALYQSTEPIEEEQKEALYQIQMLKEGLEKLGKTPI